MKGIDQDAIKSEWKNSTCWQTSGITHPPTLYLRDFQIKSLVIAFLSN